MSRIEQIIAEIEDFIDSCKYQPLSNTKIIVNRDELDELIEDLKLSIPDEIKKYQRIIANRDAILKDAQDKSDSMIKRANKMTSDLVSEHEVMQQAYKEAAKVIEDATNQAGRILDKATAEANELRRAAMQYTDNSLADIQDILSDAIENLTVKNDAIIRSLESTLDVTTQNRKELHATPIPESTYAVRKEAEEAFEQYDDGNAAEEYVEEYTDEYEDEYDDYEDLDEYDEYVDEVPEDFEEPVYGQHNPNRFDYADPIDEELLDHGNVEEITNFNLDISDFK
ncbi:MAG: ATPase [Lachnospiraceae bacterium]|nr:ATPase [Lachnospiraceae bacterium]